MKKKLELIIPFFILIILTTSCSHKYYAPNDGEFLVLTKRNDLHLSQSVSGGNISSINTQLGFSPIKHVGLSGSFFKTKGSRSNNSGNTFIRKGDGKIWNTAIGGYYPFIFKNQFERKKSFGESHQSGILADIYFGYGKGEVNNYYEIGGSSHFKFDKKYVQLGIHLMLEGVNVGYQIRAGRLNYYDGKVFGQATGLVNEGFNILNEQNNFKLIEHAIRFSYGVKQFRVYLLSTGVAYNKNLNKLGIKKSNTTIGVILEIDEFFRKKKKEEIEKIEKIEKKRNFSTFSN